jgi:hypothetical protein
MVAKDLNQSELWHLRYGHLNINGLKLLNQKQIVYGLPKINQIGVCEGCIFGKQAKFPFPKAKVFKDDYSRMSWVYFLQSKGEAFRSFKVFKDFVEKQYEKKLKALRTERGGEFLSKEFIDFCENEGIHRELTTPYTPEQNGVAEKKNRTVVEMGRSMLKYKNLPNKFWAEAVATAVYVLNISPTKSVWNKTPFEAWFERRRGVSHLRVFGCIAYAFVNPQKRTKLDEKPEKCIFIGYCTQSKGYRLYSPESGKITVSRNVIFDENANWKCNEETQGAEIIESIELDDVEDEVLQQPSSQVRSDLNSSNYDPDLPTDSPDRSQNSDPNTPTIRAYTRRPTIPDTPVRKMKSVQELYETTQVLFVVDATTYEEAAKNKEWHQAMLEEGWSWQL